MAFDPRGYYPKAEDYNNYQTKTINSYGKQYKLKNNGLLITHHILYQIGHSKSNKFYNGITPQEQELIDKLDIHNAKTYVDWLRYKQAQAVEFQQDDPNLAAWTWAFSVLHLEPELKTMDLKPEDKAKTPESQSLEIWCFNLDDKESYKDKLGRYYDDLTQGLKITNPYDLDSITYNQALFTILGLSPYILNKANKKGIIFNIEPIQDNDIDKYLYNTVEGVTLEAKFYDKERIDIHEFINWACESGFMTIYKNKNIRQYNANREQAKSRRMKEIKEILLRELPREPKALTANKLSSKEYLQLGNLSRQTIRKYLATIFKSDWFKKQPENIQNKVKKPQS